MLEIIIQFIEDKIIPLFVGFTIIGLIKFTFCNLVYVTINCVKTITSAKADPNDKKAKRVSAWISTFCYMWYTVILKMIAQNNIVESFIGTGISNYFGSYLGIGVSKKLVKRNWKHCKINISRQKYTKEQIKSFINALNLNHLKFNVSDKFKLDPITLKKTKRYYEFTIFSKSEKQDNQVYNIIDTYHLTRRSWLDGGPVEDEDETNISFNPSQKVNERIKEIKNKFRTKDKEKHE